MSLWKKWRSEKERRKSVRFIVEPIPASTIKIKRKIFTDTSTIGELSIDGVFQCYTLEDTCRNRDKNRNDKLDSGEKVYGVTAIPAGRYRLVIDRSPKFGEDLPHLLDVPFFDGIRIHAGNREEHSLGCVLVGKTKGSDFVGNSRDALKDLMGRLRPLAEKEKLFISVIGGLSAGV